MPIVPSPDTFATREDLQYFLHLPPFSDADAISADMAVAAASDAIRSYTRQHLSLVTGDTVILDAIATVSSGIGAGYGSASVGGSSPGYGSYGFVQTLQLPEAPVVAVSAISIDGTALGSSDYYWNASGLLWRPYGFVWGYQSHAVVVTYDHGFDPVPQDIRGVCLSAAARLFVNPVGQEKEMIGNYSTQYSTPTTVVGLLEEGEKYELDRYRPVVLA